jgi:nitrate reductase NapE component
MYGPRWSDKDMKIAVSIFVIGLIASAIAILGAFGFIAYLLYLGSKSLFGF